MPIMLRSRAPASISPSPNPLRVGTCLRSLRTIIDQVHRWGRVENSRSASHRQGSFRCGGKLSQRLLGLLRVGRLAVPVIVAFHVRNALARHGSGDDHLRLADAPSASCAVSMNAAMSLPSHSKTSQLNARYLSARGSSGITSSVLPSI